MPALPQIDDKHRLTGLVGAPPGAWLAAPLFLSQAACDANPKGPRPVTTFYAYQHAAGDGLTDDARALQALLDNLQAGDTLDFGNRTYLIGSALKANRLLNVHLTGKATLTAEGGSEFEFILDISHTAGVVIDGLIFDANKSKRGAASGLLSCLNVGGTRSCTLSGCIFRNSLGVTRGGKPKSSVAVAASAGCEGLRVSQCTFADCGLGANSRSSDGIFVRGTDCEISNCHADRVTDTAFVLEGCSKSRIVNCTATNCTSIAGISNDTAQDVEGNSISGVSGTSNYLGSFGGIVAVLAFGRGAIRNCVVENVSVRAADDAQGGGPGLFFHGPLDAVRVTNAEVDAGSTRGVMNHGIAIDGVTSLDILDSHVRADGVGACIRLINDSRGVRIERNRLENGAFGIFADGSSRFSEHANTYANCHDTVGVGGSARRI